MADTPGDFLDLMRRVRERDERAAEELYQKYGCHILKVVRRRLHQPLRTRFDSTDFLQSVWTTFFADAARAGTFESPKELIGFLVKVAVRKVAGAYRRGLQTAKDQLHRERSLDDRPRDGDDGSLQNFVAGSDPTPSQEAVAHERWQRLLDGQPAVVRHVLILRREGYTNEEIARMMHVTPKTIQRLLRRLKEQFS